jgi:integral membrane sensor signal transduction histidine kinase
VNIFKNRNSRKTIILGIIVIMLSTGIFWVINNIQYRKYLKIVNAKIDNIISQVIEKYPDITEEAVLKILKNNETPESSILEKYGYTPDISYIKTLGEQIETNKKQNIALVIILGTVSLGIYLIYVITQEKKIAEINEYIKQINNKNYILKIEENDNGELSKLRNELYKTTVLLKETAEISEKEKENLSTAIADISHQLKTPLTSIRIMLDNIQDDPDMEKEVREDFLREISKQIDWISSLVVALLKIAKFDAGTIKMENNEINAKNLIDNIISNLAILMELKNIEIITNVDEKATFIADYKWQQEALTNILKNAIEHSKHNSRIYITVENTNLFLKIIIKDEGSGIDKEDLKHIFQRFYKTKNSSENSIGIGLPLAKAIIEQSNGYIKVETKYGEGTSFEVKYIK